MRASFSIPAGAIQLSELNLMNPNIREKYITRKWYEKKNAILTACILPVFLDMFACGVLIPVLPKILVNKGINADYLGLLYAAYSIGLLIFLPIFGFLNDEYQRFRLYMNVGYIILIVSNIIFIFGGSSVFLLFLSRIIGGIGGAILWATSMSTIGSIAMDDLGYMLGTVLSWGSIGFSAGPLIGGVLFEFFGESSIFLSVMALSALGVIQRNIVDETFLVDKKHQWIVMQQTHIIETYKTILINPKIVLGILLNVANGIVMSGLEPIMPLYLESTMHITSSSLIGLIFITLVIPNILLGGIVGKAADKHGSMPFVIIGLVATALSFIFLSYSSEVPRIIGVPYIVVGLLLIGISNTVCMVPAFQFVGQGSNAPGKVYAVLNAAYALGMVIGPIISIPIYYLLHYKILLLVFANLVILCSVICIMLKFLYFK